MEKSQWRKSFGDFLHIFVPAVGILAAWITADSLNAEWAFWASALVAAAYAFLRWLYPLIRRGLKSLKKLWKYARDYPNLERTAAKYKSKLEDLDGKMQDLRESADERFNAGVSAGRKRALGEYYSGQCNAKLTPAIMANREGDLRLAVTVDPPEIMPLTGSLWILRIKSVRHELAILKVSEQIPDDGTAILTVEVIHDEPHMDRLAQQARTDSDAPASLEIARREYESITELEEDI